MSANPIPAAGSLPATVAVAQVATDLARMTAGPATGEDLAAVRADIETHGLETFFQAAALMLTDQARVPGAAGGPAPQALPFAPFPVAGSQGRIRQMWQDVIGSRLSQPLRIYHPGTLDDLRSIVQQAEANDCRVKAVGSGHSFADVAVTRDFLVETHGLNRPLPFPLERGLLRAGAAPETLFETEAGITVRDLNEALWNAGLGLENMGGYDGQTIAGVISTSTHGSGLAYGPLSSQAVSLTIVAAGGRTVRVEPANGITEPGAWAARHPDIELKQDDEWFRACQVGIGCMGIVYSVVLRVKPRYFMIEQRTLGLWSQIRLELQSGNVFRDNDHYEILVNPYATQPNGDHTCLVTRRNPVPEPAAPTVELPRRNFLIELASSVPGPSAALLAVINAFPWSTPFIIDGATRAIVGDYVDRSYRVFNIGAANNVPAYGSEIGVPMERYLDAIECIFATAARRQTVGQAFLTSPFSLRFVKASEAHMSMMQGADTCMIEFPMLDQTIGGRELLQEIETQLYPFGGRPHWGLLNFLSGAGGLIESMYPLLPKWQAVRCELDPDGRFANGFTERCGLTPRAPARS